jgi:hypothetical protein
MNEPLTRLRRVVTNFGSYESNHLLQGYINEFESIQGWLNPQFIHCLLILHEHQLRTQIGGSLIEIGIHHGKSFIPLYLLGSKEDTAIAIDPFESNKDKNHPNYDALDHFLRNLDQYKTTETTNFVLIKKESQHLNSSDILKQCADVKARFFSVDGNHSFQNTLHDLKLAEECLCKGGIILLDDFLRYRWPAVTEAYFHYFTNRSSPIKPFLLGYNKLFMAHENFCFQYQESILKHQFENKIIEETLMNNKILVISK